MNTTNLWFMHVHLFGMQYRPERSDSIWTISVFQRKECLLAGAGMHFVCDMFQRAIAAVLTISHVNMHKLMETQQASEIALEFGTKIIGEILTLSSPVS